MKPLHVKIPSEQVADHLRNEILAQTWMGTLPGEGWLASKLSVGRDTIKAALSQLEKEGLLMSQGAGRPRRIEKQKKTNRNLRVRILLYGSNDVGINYITSTRYQLELSGHNVAYASKTLFELQHDPTKVEALVNAEEADAWIVVAGSKPVLKWFTQSGIPVFALFGLRERLPIAGTGPNKRPKIRELANWLVDLGHQRIVMMVRKDRRVPHLGEVERAFLEELESRGITTGSYNIPDWEDSPTGFQNCLEALLQVTPPTVLYLDTKLLFYAAQHYLARHPKFDFRQISLICSEYDPFFEWCEPSIAYLKFDSNAVVQHIVHWVNKTSLGKNDIRQTSIEVELFKGETVKPPLLKK